MGVDGHDPLLKRLERRRISHDRSDQLVRAPDRKREAGVRQAIADHEGSVHRIHAQAAAGTASVMRARGRQTGRQIHPPCHASLRRISKLFRYPFDERPQSFRQHGRLRAFDRAAPLLAREVEQLRQHHRVMSQPLRDDPPVAEAIAVSCRDLPVPRLDHSEPRDLPVGQLA